MVADLAIEEHFPIGRVPIGRSRFKNIDESFGVPLKKAKFDA
jgi:hypothetical protein